MKVMFAGDTHGNIVHWKYLFEQAKRFEVDIILQLGDFGFWEHTRSGVDYLDGLASMAATYKTPIYFVDGNHENHDLLRERYIEPQQAAKKPGQHPFITIREGIYHAPRGARWEWDGVKFLSVGGAYSIDRAWRKAGSSFWFDEVLTDKEAMDAAATGPCDIMVSHDVPMGMDMNHIFRFRGVNYSHIPASEYNRKLLREVVEGVSPTYIYHGHYHVRYNQDLLLTNGNTVKVHGLSCDGTEGDSFTIVDLEELTNGGPVTYYRKDNEG